MKDNEDLVKRLKANPRYREALGRARSPVERKAIAEFVEGFVGGVGAALGPVIAAIEGDPTLAMRLAKAVNEGSDVLSNSEPTLSGSVN